MFCPWHCYEDFLISQCRLFHNLNVGTIITLIFLLEEYIIGNCFLSWRAQLSIQGILFIFNKKDYIENEWGNKTVKAFLNVNIYLLLQNKLKKLDKGWNISKRNTIPYLKLLLLWVISHSGYILFKTRMILHPANICYHCDLIKAEIGCA